MNRGAAGCGYPQPGYRGYRRSDSQANSATRWSHRVRHFPPQTERQLATDGACYSPAAKPRSVTCEQDLDYLTRPEKFIELKRMSDRYGKRYEGRGHSRYANEIKGYTKRCKRPLNDQEQNRLILCLQEFKPQTHWSWFSLTNVTQSFTVAGLLTVQQHTGQDVRNAQAVLLTDLLEAVHFKCKERSEVCDIDTRGTANMLWAMAKLVDNDQEVTPLFKETVTALLPHVIRLQNRLNPMDIVILVWSTVKLLDKEQEPASELKEVVMALLPSAKALRDQFHAQGVANLLWAVAKLLDNGQELTKELKEFMAVLLPRVRALSDLLEPQGISNLLWAIAKVVGHGQELTSELKEAAAALLPRVNALQACFSRQEIANLLWAAAKLVDRGYELATELKETVATLLPRMNSLQAHFTPQDVANLLWAAAKLVDRGYGLTVEIKEAVVSLLPRVNALQAHFTPRVVSNSLWAVAKLVDHGHELTTELKEAVVILLSRADALQTQFKSQAISNLLWAGAKLVDHGHELTAELKEAVAALLPRMNALQTHFSPQSITNLLWAVAKLVDHGHELTVELKEAVVILLPRVKAGKDQFVARGITSLLWSLAKLVEKGQELPSELQEALVVLLPRVNALKADFESQEIANLLWALARLLDNGLEMTPDLKDVLANLVSCVIILRNRFNVREISKLLWATGSLGDLISTAAGDSLAEFMFCQSQICHLFTQQQLLISLWGLLVCGARHYLDKNSSAENDSLECVINRLFTRLENVFIDNEQDMSVMALVASWLGRECPVEPHYQKRASATQSVFCDQLQSALPYLKIEQEKSLHSLPPVDLFLPEHNIVIEIQGPAHYVGDFKTRNGRTLLKRALLQKAGYDVLEIAANRLDDPTLASMYIDRIRQKTMAKN